MPDPLRIAVIDSGVHPDHPHIDAARLLPGFAIARDGRDSEDDTGDRLGHGTAVTAAIQAGRAVLSDKGLLAGSAVIPAPKQEIVRELLEGRL